MSRVLVEVRVADEAEPLVEVVQEMIGLANRLGLAVTTAISGYPLVVEPGGSADQIVADWEAGAERRLYG